MVALKALFFAVEPIDQTDSSNYFIGSARHYGFARHDLPTLLVIESLR